MFFSGFICDKCKACYMIPCTESKVWLTKMAREKGWTIGKEVTCPYCQKRKGKKNNAKNQ